MNTLARLKKDTEKLYASVTSMPLYINAELVEEVLSNEQTHRRPHKAWWILIFSVTHSNKGNVPPSTLISSAREPPKLNAPSYAHKM